MDYKKTNAPQTNPPQTNAPQTNPPQTTARQQTTVPQTTRTPQTEPPAPAKKLYSISCTVGGEWTDGEGNKAQGATFTVTNNSGNDVGDWTLVMEIDGLVSINCWGGDCTISGNTLTIKNLSYTSGISNGGSREISCNIFTKNGVKIKSATLNGASVQIL